MPLLTQDVTIAVILHVVAQWRDLRRWKVLQEYPSDITLVVGEHRVKVTIAGKEWSRTVQVSTGEIRLHAEIAERVRQSSIQIAPLIGPNLWSWEV